MFERLKERAAKLKKDVYVLYLALKDRRTPVLAKILAALTVAYALSPIDLIPDLIPVLGYLDDLIILPALVVLTVKLVPKDLMAELKERQEENIESHWYYSIPIILVYLLIIFVIVKAIIG